MKITSIVAACLLAGLAGFAQQEPQYSQIQFNSLLEINPSYAGAHDNASMSLRFRKQWVSFTGAPTSLSLNGETKIINDNFGVGLSIVNDKLGVLNSTSSNANIATHIAVGKSNYIAFGLKMGAEFIRSDFSKLSNVDLTDPLYQDKSANIFSLGFGGMYYSQKMYVGFAVPRIISVESGTSQTKISKPHYFTYLGYRFEVDDDLEVRPAILAKYQAQAPLELDFAVDMWFKQKVGFGASYRTNDAVSVMAKMKLKQLYVGYSFDMTVSKLRTLNAGTHEIYLGYEFEGNRSGRRNQNNRYF